MEGVLTGLPYPEFNLIEYTTPFSSNDFLIPIIIADIVKKKGE
jgi:hypothetical protein